MELINFWNSFVTREAIEGIYFTFYDQTVGCVYRQEGVPFNITIGAQDPQTNMIYNDLMVSPSGKSRNLSASVLEDPDYNPINEMFSINAKQKGYIFFGQIYRLSEGHSYYLSIQG